MKTPKDAYILFSKKLQSSRVCVVVLRIHWIQWLRHVAEGGSLVFFHPMDISLIGNQMVSHSREKHALYNVFAVSTHPTC